MHVLVLQRRGQQEVLLSSLLLEWRKVTLILTLTLTITLTLTLT